MFRFKIVALAFVVTATQWLAFAQTSDAGLLRNWLNRRRARLNQPVVAPVAQTASYAGLQPGQCARTCQQTCSRVVVNYVPCTSYRTSYERVPVTQYRPQTSTDPCTGCSVTCMRPCTTYTYRMRQVPYTTYRPVYRTETYRVPVTTITNDCNTCGTSAPGCSTCSTGLVGTQLPASGTLSTEGSYNLPGTSFPPGSTVTPLPTPADTTPSINPQDSNRSVIDGATGGSSTRIQFPQQQTDSWALTSNQSTANRDWQSVAVVASRTSPVTKRWNYSPVKQASYVSVSGKRQLKTIRGKFTIAKESTDNLAPQNGGETSINSAWKTVNW